MFLGKILGNFYFWKKNHSLFILWIKAFHGLQSMFSRRLSSSFMSSKENFLENFWNFHIIKEYFSESFWFFHVHEKTNFCSPTRGWYATERVNDFPLYIAFYDGQQLPIIYISRKISRTVMLPKNISRKLSGSFMTLKEYFSEIFQNLQTFKRLIF